MNYLRRDLEAFCLKANDQFPVLAVTGARQVGKTSLLRHLSREHRSYVTLDDPLVLQLAKEDPALFMQRYPAPVLIDEFQYAPELLPHIKMAVDERREPGMFWLTGSQQFSLMEGITESLAGRVAVTRLLGMSRREVQGKGGSTKPFLPTESRIREGVESSEPMDLKALYRAIWRGTLPAIATDPNIDRDLFFGSYVQTYLQRDVRALAQVGDEMAFLRFLRTAAARTGQMLNLADMSRDADIAPNTAKQWLSILQASGVVQLLEPYHSNVTKRLVKAPKLYFLDTGLCAYLTEWSSPETLEAGAMSGPILETWVFTEILKTWLHNGQQPPFYYFRDRDAREIDLLIVQDGQVFPLEFKKTASPRKSAIKHFPALESLGKPIGPGGVICLIEDHLPFSEYFRAISIRAI